MPNYCNCPNCRTDNCPNGEEVIDRLIITSITAELRHLYQNMITEGAVKDTVAIAK